MDSNFLKNTFSKVINDYDYARPGYPEALYEQISTFSGIPFAPGLQSSLQESSSKNGQTLTSQASLDLKPVAILEVGAGTGQATDWFANNLPKAIAPTVPPSSNSAAAEPSHHSTAPYQLNLLEVSDEQVDFLRAKYAAFPDIAVQKAYFEEYQSDQQYDLIYSATAFHWVKSEVGYPRAWELLKPGGTLAVFWQMSSVTYYDGGIFDGLNALKQKYLPGESLGFDAAGIGAVKERRIQQIQSGGFFGAPEVFEFRWTDTYDADRYAALINTYSSTQTLPEKVREAYLAEIKNYIRTNGGIVKLPQLVMLYLVRR